MYPQKGFTLVELMISLTLGLIVIATATTLFLTSLKSMHIQDGLSDLQDNANFGLNYITQDIRLANLDTSTAAIVNDTQQGAGIVLSRLNFPEKIQKSISLNLLSRGDGDAMGSGNNQWAGHSNVTQNSDQLVIQYKPKELGGFDCEGQAITNTQDIIVQRYFLRPDKNVDTVEGNPLVLACDAGRYTEGSTSIAGLGGAGEIIMQRVDHFHVLLNVLTETGQRRYIGIHEYMNLNGEKPRILAVNLGILARSSRSVGQGSELQQEKSFEVLDQTVALKNQLNSQNFLRQVVTQEIALRNALGDRE